MHHTDHDEKIQECGMTALLMATMRLIAQLTLQPVMPRDNSDMANLSIGVVAVGLGFSGLIC